MKMHPLMKIGIVLGLLIIGVTLIATTAYQVKVKDPTPDDMHYTPQPAVYEWRTRNPLITMIGAILIMTAIVLFVLFALEVVP